MARSHNASADKQEPLILLVPGLEGSGPGHWQRRWAEEIDNCQIAELGSWDTPHRNTWINRLNLAVHRAGRPVVLVAHSLGCVLTAWWSKFEQPGYAAPVIGAMLVAPPEVDFFPRDERLTGFAPTPADALPFPSLLVASRNDPWIGFDTAKGLARRWGSDFVDAGNAGHINADSGLGSWEDGKHLLARLLDGQVAAAPVSPRAAHGDWAEGLEYRA
ncbi:alpha/beta hydrolase [Novosphingobium sp. P6W]|uniref:RBBP9/YdeN family alpha/beta hydrolase n=1 Tax=Novosphingobium sp. P6W TaxID=1609758 RepID=UPI0005C3240D|nr:alpha/beta hydrolase [Novosphingobium sp. P6W]AXB76988.1 alpha/beta hydrolase [Novosphingobium sp. P6W]KIS33172.1 esterase [Novosphingobium sp. P6W]